MKTGAPVLPVAVLGAGNMVRRLDRLLPPAGRIGRGGARPVVTVRIGAPLSFAAPGGVLNRRQWLDAAELVRQAMAGLVGAGTDLLPAAADRRTTMEP